MTLGEQKQTFDVVLRIIRDV